MSEGYKGRVYYKLPVLYSNNNRCQFCGNTLENFDLASIAFQKGTKIKKVSLVLPHCKKCHIHFYDQIIIDYCHKKHPGYKCMTYNLKSNSTLEKTKAHIFSVDSPCNNASHDNNDDDYETPLEEVDESQVFSFDDVIANDDKAESSIIQAKVTENKIIKQTQSNRNEYSDHKSDDDIYKYYVFKKIPLIGNNKKCYFCGKVISKYSSQKIMIYNNSDESLKLKVIHAEMLYCQKCEVKYASARTMKEISDYHSLYKPFTFTLRSSDNIRKFKKEIRTLPFINAYCPKEVSCPDFISEGLGRGQTGTISRKIYATNFLEGKCKLCGKDLFCEPITIPVSHHKGISFYSKTCGNHFFVNDVTTEKISNILNNNPFSSFITVNTDFYDKSSAEAEKLFRTYNGASALINLKYQKNNFLSIIIAKSNRKISDDIWIMDYHDKETRRLLTEIYKFENSEVIIGAEKYEVIYFTKSKQIFSDIELEKGGGLYESIQDEKPPSDKVLMDILLYSPFSKCYEIQKATYIKDSHVCYVDAKLFRNFVKKYGNPGINFYISYHSSSNIIKLKDESLLHELGYNVNKDNGLSQLDRQEILKDVIDMKLMSQNAIITLLTALIAMNSKQANKASACSKWEADLQFVSDYNYNPSRFLIYNR